MDQPGTAPSAARTPVADGRRFSRVLRGPAAALGAAALVLYGFTLAPTVTLVDSGELIVAADGLGVPHPPSFPFYTLLAHAATRLPLGNIAQRVHWLSAACGAGATAVLAAVITLAALTAAAPAADPTRRGNRKRESGGAPQSENHPSPQAHAITAC